MSRSLLVFVAVLALLSLSQAQRGDGGARDPPIAFATATVAGDPHFTTFDGRYHDVMIPHNNYFTMVKNNIINVQSRAVNCNGLITCLRDSLVQIDTPYGETIKMSYGMWAGVVDNVRIVEVKLDGTNNTVNMKPSEFRKLYTLPNSLSLLDGKYRVSMTSSLTVALEAVGVWATLPPFAIQVAVGNTFLSVALPKSGEGHLSTAENPTNGLLGYFDGDKLNHNEWRFANNTVSNIKQLGSRIYYTASLLDKNVFDWANSFAVTSSVMIFNEVSHPHQHLTMLNVHEHFQQVAPVSTVKSDVNFADPQKLLVASKACRELLTRVPNAADELYENCLMDYSIDDAANPGLSASEIAASVSVAALAADAQQKYQAPPPPALSPVALTAIITVSVVLGVALIAVLGLVFYNRRLKAQVDSYALVVRDQDNSGNAVLNSGSIQL